MDLCIILVFVAVSIGMGREAGYGMDRDCSDPGGRAKYIPVPAKWKWLFRLQHDTYASGNKILKASVGIYLSGYIAAIIELLIFFFAVFSGCEWEIAADWAYKICLSTGVLSGIFFAAPVGIKYDYNMGLTYDYDWVTFLQVTFLLNPKRRCKVVYIIDETLCEITFGRFGRRRHLAETQIPVKVGDEKYAVHRYGDVRPYWEIRNHLYNK